MPAHTRASTPRHISSGRKSPTSGILNTERGKEGGTPLKKGDNVTDRLPQYCSRFVINESWESCIIISKKT
jgi:hypothetical protein